MEGCSTPISTMRTSRTWVTDDTTQAENDRQCMDVWLLFNNHLTALVSVLLFSLFFQTWTSARACVRAGRTRRARTPPAASGASVCSDTRWTPSRGSAEVSQPVIVIYISYSNNLLRCMDKLHVRLSKKRERKKRLLVEILTGRKGIKVLPVSRR